MPSFLARTSDRDVPTAAILISSVFASLLVLSGAVPGLTGVLTLMLQLATAATLWCYFGACIAALRLGVARVPAAISALFCVWVLAGAETESVLLSIALMLTAVPLYRLRPVLSEQPA
jgi:APA family basic amino acid/polyamine antiporter